MFCAHVVPARRIVQSLIMVDQCSDDEESIVLIPDGRSPYTGCGTICRGEAGELCNVDSAAIVQDRTRHKPFLLNSRLSRVITFPSCRKFWRSFVAMIGTPGMALKELVAQKKVSSHSVTSTHEGSGWKPGSTCYWSKRVKEITTSVGGSTGL